MLRPAEAANIATFLSVTCGNVQVQANPEPTTFNTSGRKIMIRWLLAMERQQRRGLTIDALLDEIAENPQCRQLTLPQHEEWQVKGVRSTYHVYFPVPVKVNIDGVDMRLRLTLLPILFPWGSVLVNMS